MADPMYRQIAEDLRQQIESGELAPGAQLPTELELREQYDASRNTVRDAIKWLITRGLVETRPGQGTFVVEKISALRHDADRRSGDGRRRGWHLRDPEVKARRRVAAASTPRVEIQRRASRAAGNCNWPWARRSSADISSGTSMARHGRCRPPSTP